MDALNHSRMLSLISSATLRVLPDFKAAAERDIEKFSFSAIANTLSRVIAETKSGRVNERETVDTDT
ncbi:Uncharacterised protein [Chlamydia trachomatis]|nr:Uncharacterised protein [Chlamydia trachomatis]